MWGWAWDHAEEGSNLMPSREPPNDCALGRLLSKDGAVVKPPGSFRRPFLCLCYPTIAPRLPSGTLVNKIAPQSKEALCVGYVGGRSGSWETVGTTHTQAGYLCWLPDEGRTLVTSDVRIVPSCKPALRRTSRGGGGRLTANHFHFTTRLSAAREAPQRQRAARAATARAIQRQRSQRVAAAADPMRRMRSQ